MEVEKEKRIHTILSNTFYYLFIILLGAIVTTVFLSPDLGIVIDVLFISLIVSSVIIIFYLTVQMMRYNLKVNKKAQIGVFLIIIGFLLILLSTSKQLSFGGNYILTILGDNFFVYWGIGSLLIGIFVEITILDQLLWNAILTPLKFIWKQLKTLFKWIVENWKPVLLYTLDVIALTGIILVSYYREGFDWWKIVILVVSCVYPPIHHYKRIWRAVTFIFVDVIYVILVKIGEAIKRFFDFIWGQICDFFAFLKEHWWTVLKEFLRLVGVAGGVVMIYFGATTIDYLLWIGIVTIIFSEVFTRKIVLVSIWNAFVNICLKFWGMIEAIFAFLKEHWWTILKEFLRLVGVAGGGVMIYFSVTTIDYLLWIGIVTIIVSEIFTRKIVLVSIWNVFVKICLAFWDVVNAIFEFLKEHWWVISREFIRLIFSAGGVVMFKFTYNGDLPWYFYLIGVTVILLSEIILRKVVLVQLAEFIKNLSKVVWEILKLLVRPLHYIWRTFINLLKLIKEHWFKILLYTLDVVAIAAIIYSAITMDEEWWFIVLISVCCLYIPVHHYKIVWRIIKFIGVNIFYNGFMKIVSSIQAFFEAIHELLKIFGKFIKEHIVVFLKEIARLLGVAGGIYLIVIGARDVNLNYLIWIGLVVIITSQLLSRKVILEFIFNSFKAIYETLLKYRVNILRVLGLGTVIFGVAIAYSWDWGWGWEVILIVTVGSIFILFAHFIFHPKKFWQLLVKIPKFIKNVLETVWLSTKTAVIYVSENFLRLILLLIMVFTFAYGISVVFTWDFIGILENNIDSVGIVSSIGGMLVVVSIAAFILLRRQMKKLRTGASKQLAKDIKERWKDD